MVQHYMLNIDINKILQHHMLNIDVKNGTNELQYQFVRATIGVSLSSGLVFMFGGEYVGRMIAVG